jgi:hypothetical protein
MMKSSDWGSGRRGSYARGKLSETAKALPLDRKDWYDWGGRVIKSALTSTGTLVNDGATLLYRASKYDCDACELKPRCCPKMPARKVPRSIYENARDVARDIAKTEAYVTSRRERKKIEMLFAHLKRILRLDRLRLRGPFGAQDEFLLAATVQNLRKLAKLIPLPAPMPTWMQTSSRTPDSLQRPK